MPSLARRRPGRDIPDVLGCHPQGDSLSKISAMDVVACLSQLEECCGKYAAAVELDTTHTAQERKLTAQT